MSEQQLSFEDIFAASAQEAATAHLPGDIEHAIPFYRGLIERFNAAMLDGDIDSAEKISEEAHDLAVKLNGGDAGIMADNDAPAYVLERGTHADAGTVPLWGQTGEFVITVGEMKVRIELEGIFGIGAMPIPGFSTHIVDPEKPFLSDTGYRSFVGCSADPEMKLTPDAAVKHIIEHYIKTHCKGKLTPLKPEYRERFQAALPQP